MKTTKPTRDALAPHRARTNGGRVRRFDVYLPVMKVTNAMDNALRSEARALGIPLAEHIRRIFAAHTGIPTEEPTLDTTKETR